MWIYSKNILFVFFLVWICVWLRPYYFDMCLSAVYHCCVLRTLTNLHFVIISSFKRSDVGCVIKIVYYFPTYDRNIDNNILYKKICLLTKKKHLQNVMQL